MNDFILEINNYCFHIKDVLTISYHYNEISIRFHNNDDTLIIDFRGEEECELSHKLLIETFKKYHKPVQKIISEKRRVKVLND